MNNKLVPALIGGAIMGLLSGLLAYVPFANWCCCLWSIGGGALAVMFYVKKSPTPVRVGEGAMLGALAGLIGGAIYFVLASIMGLIFGAAQMEAAMRQTGMKMPLSGTALLIIGAFIGALFLVGLATIGGLIGVPIFEKRKGDAAPPPPPPPFGDQPGGGGFAGGGGAGYPGGGGSYGSGA
ncbi:MAG: hypothetical protein JOZ52_06265 [Acidobacteria bacterium]|nr:hypothetical protein [Acidobacteriota bacterium]